MISNYHIFQIELKIGLTKITTLNHSEFHSFVKQQIFLNLKC